MRIGFDSKRLFLNNRGLGNYARNLLYGFATYHPKNEFFLYTPKDRNEYISPSLLNSPNVHVRLPSGLSKSAGSLWRTFSMGAMAAGDSLDIFHGLSQEIPRDYAKSGAKTVVTVHDLIFIRHKEFYRPIDRWIYNNKVKHAVRYADKIVAISKQTKDDILQEFNVSEEKIEIIYQSCHEVFYSRRTETEKARVRKKWNLPEEFMLSVGALNENKNIGIILDAMVAGAGQFDLPLVVVGKGADYRQRLEDKIRALNLKNRVIFASDVASPSQIELSSFYQMASLFIFPSFYEGFGIPILEARFSGIPVIASDSTCLDEAGGKGALYISPTDPAELATAIVKALSSPEELSSHKPEEFSMQPLSQQMIDLYKSL